MKAEMEEEKLQIIFTNWIEEEDELVGQAVSQHIFNVGMYAEAIEYEKIKVGGKKKGNVERNFLEGHNRIMADYFWPKDKIRTNGSMLLGPVYSDKAFRRRFCMSRNIFTKIFVQVVRSNDFFRQGLRPNCTGKFGLSPIQKVFAAVRQLCYGLPSDAVDEYVRIGETTALICLKTFCKEFVITLREIIYEYQLKKI